jgi:hypothetical protein
VNRYGLIAQRYWTTYLPSRVAALMGHESIATTNLCLHFLGRPRGVLERLHEELGYARGKFAPYGGKHAAESRQTMRHRAGQRRLVSQTMR